MPHSVSALRRIALAFIAFFRILFNGAFALQVDRLVRGELVPKPEPKPEPRPEPRPEPKPEPRPEPKKAPDLSPALRILGLLQRDGRLIDFLQDDVTSYSDEEVGAAARVVHSGCKKALQAYLRVEPVLPQAEGDSVSIEKGFDPGKIRLTGNVTGEPPFRGTLTHHGWRATELTLPDLPPGQDPAILAPAEVEL